ncbi:MAG TPA: pyridoxamine 5'-phosphate oxidase family protein [Capillimicrobium sp.]|jgi:predicted pyridoxine 5'-phosphate oxidase superfamily flavin-nucleotide-binding protein
MADTSPWHEGSRELQERFDTRRLADKGAELLFDDAPRLTAEQRAFIARMEMVFVATADADGVPHCSYKGGAPGFVRAIDDRTLVLPNYDGNGFYDSWGNVRVNPAIDLLFIDFAARSPWRLRVKGRAELRFDDPLVERFPGAQFVVVVTPTRIYPVCPRYVHRMEIVERSRFVPDDEGAAPVAQWKLTDVPPEVLAAGDPARATAERVRDGAAPPAPTHDPSPGL